MRSNLEDINAPQRRLGRWVTILLVILTIALLSVVTWLSYGYQEILASRILEDESNKAATQIRMQLLRDVQTLQLLALHSNNNANNTINNESSKLLYAKLEALQAERPEIMRIEWWNTESDKPSQLIMQVISNAAPHYLKKNTVNTSLYLPEVSKLTLETTFVNQQELFSPPYAYELTPSTSSIIYAVDVWVPQWNENEFNNKSLKHLRLTYNLNRLLIERVSKDIVNEHDLALILPNGTEVARQLLSKRGKVLDSAMSLIDLPGLTLQLKVTDLKGLSRFIPNLLTSIVFFLVFLLLLALGFLFKDIRKRLNVQRALEQHNALRKAMEDALVTGLRARDLNGYTTYVNPALCEMVGFSALELIGRAPPMPYWAPEAMPEYQARHAKVLAGTINRDGFETIFMHKNGKRFPVLMFEAPLLNEYGKQTGWMSSIVDTSVQKNIELLARQQQEQLAQQARLATMGELSTSLSHELNQPLAAISSYATATLNMMQSGVATPHDIQEGLLRISKQAQRAGQVIRSVHDFVRRKNPVREVIDLKTVLIGIFPLIELQAKQTGVRIQTHYDIDLPMVLADQVMIEQVMLNLTRNAVDSMKEIPSADRVLSLEINHINDDKLYLNALTPFPLKASMVYFKVTDYGTGISKDIEETIFSAFFTTKSDGMGMGLAICRSVIESAHGHLYYQNRPEGGCTFVMALPIHSTVELPQ